MTSPRELAASFHADWLRQHPLEASERGIPGYDHLLPDVSEPGEAEWKSKVVERLSEARQVGGSDISPADAVTLSCLVEYAQQEIAAIEMAPGELTVTAMPIDGPAALVAVAARTLLPDAGAAEAYLSRLSAAPRWIDQQIDRLRAGAKKGRLPVAPLVEHAVAWADELLSQPLPEPLMLPEAPPGWSGAPTWEAERQKVLAESVKPALGRWVECLRELLPRSRSDAQPGLAHVPGGEGDYRRAIHMHTTLPLTAGDLHQIGLDAIADLEQRALELGQTIGFSGLDDVLEAVRSSRDLRGPSEAIEESVRAIRRAEAEVHKVVPAPLPEPCAVTPMPHVVASSGIAPHYTSPRRDGARPGTFWFNTELPTAGTGWDLESVAFHEAVPGHHLQIARLDLLGELADIQKERPVTVFAEGWALYSEQLAEEMGLYSGPESLLGTISAALLRAARLVVDTGLHAFGWSRQQASEFFEAHVPMAPEFLSRELDRYIAWPGQALAYHTGKQEILKAREAAMQRLGPDFSLMGFHSAVLDSGSVPMAVLHQLVERWAEQTARQY